MNAYVIASTAADARAAAAVEQHHAELAGALQLRVEALLRIAAEETGAGWGHEADHLVDWCRETLLPHAAGEEQTLYAAAYHRPEARLLVESMVKEHSAIRGLVDEIAVATTPLAAAADARALQVLFASHVEKENTVILPLLASAPDVSLADLLAGLHELAGGSEEHQDHQDHQKQGAHDGRLEGHHCGCGEVDAGGYPELDARAVPHAIRHATIFGALDGVRPGAGMVLVAPHDPKPLLAQVEQRDPGAFSVEYLERGPQAWRLAFIRQPA
jgi:uncharacterized protein (DUF2249 family)